MAVVTTPHKMVLSEGCCVTLVRVYDAQTRKVWVLGKIGWFTYCWFVAEALTLKALVTLFVLVRALGFTSYFALALSLSDRYHYLP